MPEKAETREGGFFNSINDPKLTEQFVLLKSNDYWSFQAVTFMMLQAPMISSPLKQTNEIDWVLPLKGYIRQTYGDDPERYSEECNTLNRLRQDMRGAGKDSAAGRDLLYRYYGQLELLDLRFPVDENHIKISFTWYTAQSTLEAFVHHIN